METFVRQISLENLRSRQPSLIPAMGQEDSEGKLVLSDNGCWGMFPYDVDIRKCVGFEELEKYFNDVRVSFKEINNKWHVFRNIFENAMYMKRIFKNRQYEWVPYEPYYKEKFEIPVYSREKFDLVTGFAYNGPEVVGVYPTNEFEENGGLLMIKFAMKAMGMFLVDDKYITDDNYVPEILYYTDTDVLYKKLRDMKNSDDCCVTNEYQLHGGDMFLMYLGVKRSEMRGEYDYWKRALYLDKNGNPVPPDFVLDFTLTADFSPLGIYTTVEPLEENNYFTTEYPEEYRECKITTESHLHELKRTQKTYCFNKETQKDEELPVILVDGGKENEFEFIPKYAAGIPRNVVKEGEKYYGDMIYDMEEDENEGLVYVKYVFGGELVQKNGEFSYNERSKTGIRYEETLKCEKHDYTKDYIRSIIQVIPEYETEQNIMSNTKYIKNCDNAKIIYDSENAEVEGTFFMSYPEDMTDHKVIMLDYNLGKTEQMIENVEDLIIDRGYSSALELHYKMGEVNTFEDLERYQNNTFGL